MVNNDFNVPIRQWDKWTEDAKFVFNEVYDQMNEDMELFKHPKANTETYMHWDTTAWNAAWYAADTLSKHQKDS